MKKGAVVERMTALDIEMWIRDHMAEHERAKAAAVTGTAKVVTLPDVPPRTRSRKQLAERKPS